LASFSVHSAPRWKTNSAKEASISVLLYRWRSARRGARQTAGTSVG
jgi:hypothetical protein